jgi:hypothetical protein
VELIEISGTTKVEYLKYKINDLATHSTNKNIRDLHRGIN